MSNIKEKIVSLLDNIDELINNSGFPNNLSQIGADYETIEQSFFENDVTWVCNNKGVAVAYIGGKYVGTAEGLLAEALKSNDMGLIRKLDTIVPIENTTYTTLSFAIKKLMQSGYVYPKGNEQTYLMKDANTGHTKIGKSINPKKRESGFKCSNLAISLCYVCDCNVEAELHRAYADKHVDREWFNLSDEDIMDICRSYNFIKYDEESM
ncbi:MAG: GIY-YIG nuclease family protein [Muribaculaceae bacterium]|nr:GIY-YIG nuclease family protein [Muribaculaceae bacterium]